MNLAKTAPSNLRPIELEERQGGGEAAQGKSGEFLQRFNSRTGGDSILSGSEKLSYCVTQEVIQWYQQPFLYIG